MTKEHRAELRRLHKKGLQQELTSVKILEVIFDEVPALLDALDRCEEALKEVVALSDRKHSAWDRAHEIFDALEKK